MYKNEQSGCTLADKPGGSERKQEGNSGLLHWSREKWWALDYGLYLGIGGMFSACLRIDETWRWDGSG